MGSLRVHIEIPLYTITLNLPFIGRSGTLVEAVSFLGGMLIPVGVSVLNKKYIKLSSIRVLDMCN